LLLNKAIKSVLPNETGIRSIICVDSRKYLNTTYAHQNLISSAILPYFPSYEDMPLKKQLSMLKGLLNYETIKEIQITKIKQNVYKQKLITQELTLSDKYNLYKNFPVDNNELATNTVSYIKNESLDCIEKFLTDCSIISTLYTDISIELSVLNGYFFVDFYQKFSNLEFYKAFLQQLEKNCLHYEQIDNEKNINCRNIIPGFMKKNNWEFQFAKAGEYKFSEYELYEQLLKAFEECDFHILEQMLFSYKRPDINNRKYVLDNKDLYLISQRLSNQANMIPFFVVLFFLPGISTVFCDLENLECSEILFKFISRLLEIKEKIITSSFGELCLVSVKERFLCLKRTYDTEIMYIIVNNSDFDEAIHLSEQPYWMDLFSSEIYKSVENFKCNAHEFYLIYHKELSI